MIFGKNLKFGLFSSKIPVVRDSDVIKTSLWRQMKGYWYIVWYQWKVKETHTYPGVVLKSQESEALQQKIYPSPLR